MLSTGNWKISLFLARLMAQVRRLLCPAFQVPSFESIHAWRSLCLPLAHLVEDEEPRLRAEIGSLPMPGLFR